MPVTWMNHPPKNTIESKKTTTMPLKWHRKHPKSLCFRSSPDEEIYLKQKSAKFWISDYLLVEIFSAVKPWYQGSKVQELDEKLCKHSREHWLGLDCLQELCCFFSPQNLVTLFQEIFPIVEIMQRSRATREVRVLFAMIWMQFRLYIHVMSVQYHMSEQPQGSYITTCNHLLPLSGESEQHGSEPERSHCRVERELAEGKMNNLGCT